MGDRKFYYNDLVIMDHKKGRYPSHPYHVGRVSAIHIKPEARIIYVIECECGSIHRSISMHLINYYINGHNATMDIDMARLSRMLYYVNQEGTGRKIIYTYVTILGNDKYASSLRARIDKFLSLLSDREKRLVISRHGFFDTPVSLKQLALEEGVSKSRIHAILLKCRRKMNGVAYVRDSRKKLKQQFAALATLGRIG